MSALLTTCPFRSVCNHKVAPSLDKGDVLHLQGTAILNRVGLQNVQKVLDSPIYYYAKHGTSGSIDQIIYTLHVLPGHDNNNNMGT